MNHYRPRRPAGTPGVGKTPDMAGVYYILNCRNDRIYIGQSTRMYSRLNDHVCKLTNGHHRNKALQADWGAFGSSAFEFTILVTNPEHSPLSLLELERIFLRVYQSENPIYGYNTSVAIKIAAANARRRKG